LSNKLPESTNLSGWADVRVIEDINQFSTSTASYCTACPIKLLSRDTNRQYARFINISDTAIYLYFATTTQSYNFTGTQDSGNSATSTVNLSGVYLAASGGSYELLDNNLIIDEVWATSTAASKAINVVYK
jgi:hypothetical protein